MFMFIPGVFISCELENNIDIELRQNQNVMSYKEKAGIKPEIISVLEVQPKHYFDIWISAHGSSIRCFSFCRSTMS